MDVPGVLKELEKRDNSSQSKLAAIDDQVTKPDVLHLLGSLRKSLIETETSDFVADAVEALIDISWEECNIGHWSEVPEAPKILYAYASFQKILIKLKKAISCGECKNDVLKEALAAADLGLMLGKGYETQLTRAASLITTLLGCDRVDEPSCAVEPREALKSGEQPSEEYFIEKLNVNNMTTLNCPSLEEFSMKHFHPRTPVLLTGCIDHWPALRRWNDMDYLVRVAGPRIVPVEIGSSYTHKDWGMELISFQDFISKHIRGHAPKVGYLAQHQLFDQIPELKKDIVVPDYCCLSEKEDSDCEVNINCWFGPAHTLTPLHFDPKHNLLCQVVGSKRLILYSPDDSQFLHPHDDSMLNNTAKVDPYNPDYDKFPDFKKATAYYCKLKPGEMLYIPPKWWHHVVSLDVSFSLPYEIRKRMFWIFGLALRLMIIFNTPAVTSSGLKFGVDPVDCDFILTLKNKDDLSMSAV